MENLKIGFIGGGAMASALFFGMINAKLVQQHQLVISDKDEQKLQELQKQLPQAKITKNNGDLLTCDVLVLAVKPHIVPLVLQDIGHQLNAKQLLVSIAAGVTCGTLADGCNARIARVMPNTPSLVSLGAAAVTLGPRAVPKDAILIGQMFAAVGIVVECTETNLNAVTGLSGSGPAYVFMFIEALADGGVRAGLPRALALKLATQTVLGAAMLVKETGLHPGALKDQVASPGGTTIAGIHALENAGFRSACMNAVYAASNRAIELGAPIKDLKSKL